MNNEIKSHIKAWLMRTLPNRSINEVLEGNVVLGSDIGAIRTENQDRIAFLQTRAKNNEFVVGILADGMGGMIDGAECASTAISTFLYSCIENRNEPLNQRLSLAVMQANEDVHNLYNGKGGCTLSAFIVDNEGKIAFINVGDSRIYLEEKSKLFQLTTDDTLAAQLNQKSIEANNALIQFIGLGNGLEAHIFTEEKLENISRIILSSDGFHYLSNQKIEGLLNKNESISELCRRMLLTSNWISGHDNSSILIAQNFDSFFNKVPSGTVRISNNVSELDLLILPPNSKAKELPESIKIENPIIVKESKNEVQTEIEQTDKKTPKKRSKKKNKNNPQLRIILDEI